MTRCRSCGDSALEDILTLGEMPLANSYLRAEDVSRPEPKFPLDLVRCTACQLVQITCTVPPDVLFREYLYLSSYSTTMVQHAADLVTRVTDRYGFGANRLAVEVASNDGYLLQHYLARGIPVLGIEPARNVARIARDKGVRTVEEFFDDEVARRLRSEGHVADVIHANNVLAHVANLNGFVAGFRELLRDDGVVVCESPYLGEFLRNLQFDTIYHEHLCYYSLTALVHLFRRHGLEIEDCEMIPIHGGSMRIYARHARVAKPTDQVTAVLAEEQVWGVASPRPYTEFAAGIARITDQLPALVRRLRADGKRVCAYGAAAKGTVLLNACGLDAKDLEFVCDRNPLKQGRFMPGMHVPIVAPTRLLESDVEYCLLLAWNVAEEIKRELADWSRRGGKFIVPVPNVRVLE